MTAEKELEKLIGRYVVIAAVIDESDAGKRSWNISGAFFVFLSYYRNGS